jgi:hypothetical protein
MSSLRPVLKLELIQRQPLLPFERRQFGYLYEALANRPLSTPVEFNCISIAETLAEKVLSLLRRCADNWDGHQARRGKGKNEQNTNEGEQGRKSGIDPTLGAARANTWLRQQYEKVLMPLVYDNNPPSFSDSFAAFEKVAVDLIATCESPGRPSPAASSRRRPSH